MANTPNATDAMLDALPKKVIGFLGLDPDWMRDTFPTAHTFVNINSP